MLTYLPLALLHGYIHICQSQKHTEHVMKMPLSMWGCTPCVGSVEGAQCLRIKDGMETLASRLESRRYLALMGGEVPMPSSHTPLIALPVHSILQHQKVDCRYILPIGSKPLCLCLQELPSLPNGWGEWNSDLQLISSSAIFVTFRAKCDIKPWPLPCVCFVGRLYV